MAVKSFVYFYDQQMRRTIIQFMRIFSGFRVQTGKNNQGIQEFIQVPVVYGDGSRQAQLIIQNNSENTILSVPRIACYITSLSPAAMKRGGYQGNTETLLVTERQFDQDAGSYTDRPGNRYHVDRLQPNPVDITFKVDIWTSNTDQKLQLFEQIFMLFNPSLDIQTSSSPLDWTAIQTVTLDDGGITWDESGVPRGTDENINIMSMTFTVQSYINPPARVKKQTLIHNIIQHMGDAIEDCDSAAYFEDGSTTLQNVTTPGNHTVHVMGNNIILLGPYRNLQDQDGNTYSWPKLIDQYGEIVPGSSKIRLRWVSDIQDDTRDIMGFIRLHPTIDNILMFTPIAETLPLATQAPILGFVNPHTQTPGTNLPVPVTGQRYIVTEEIGSSLAWPGIDAKMHDIVEFDGSNWSVVLDVENTNTLEFVNDLQTGDLLKLLNHQWVEAVNLQYTPGYFRLVL